MLSSEGKDVRPYRVDKPWGREYVLPTADGLLVKVIQIDDGHRTSLQYHKEKYEIHWLLDGSGTLEGSADNDEGRPRPSRGYEVWPTVVHRAVGPLLILEVSTNYPDDVVRLEDDYQR